MSILDKFIGPTAGNHNDDGKVSVLQRLRDYGRSVTVKLEGDPRPYSGVVAALNEKQMIFLLSELQPSLPGGVLAEGRMVAILASDPKKTISFTCRCLGPLVPKQDIGYMMKLGSSFEVMEFETSIDFGFPRTGSVSDALPHRRAA